MSEDDYWDYSRLYEEKGQALDRCIEQTMKTQDYDAFETDPGVIKTMDEMNDLHDKMFQLALQLGVTASLVFKAEKDRYDAQLARINEILESDMPKNTIDEFHRRQVRVYDRLYQLQDAVWNSFLDQVAASEDKNCPDSEAVDVSNYTSQEINSPS